MLKLISISVIFYFIHSCNTELIINKCCPEDQSIINLNLHGCKRSKNEEKLNDELEEWLNEPYSLSYSKSDFVFNLPCNAPRIQIYNWSQEYSIQEDGFKSTDDEITNDYCLDTTIDNENVILTCPCKHETCIHVCCPPGQSINKARFKCVPTKEEKFKNWKLKDEMIYEMTENVSFIYGLQYLPTSCDNKRYYPGLLDEYTTFHVFANGSATDEQNRDYFFKKPEDYCIGIVDSFLEDEIVNIVTCKKKNEEVATSVILYIFIIIPSAFFLLVNFFIHVKIPDLRGSFQGMCVIAHCICMFIAHASVVILVFESVRFIFESCYILGHVKRYFFITGFLWLNVICIDISRKLESIQLSFMEGASALRQFGYYALYAMLSPIPIFIFIYILNAILPSNEEFCSLVQEIALTGLEIFNLTLLVLNSIKMCKSQENTTVEDKASFRLFIYLFITTTLVYILEIVHLNSQIFGSFSFLANEFYVNIILFFIILIIFCFNKPVWHQLRQRCCCCCCCRGSQGTNDVPYSFSSLKRNEEVAAST